MLLVRHNYARIEFELSTHARICCARISGFLSSQGQHYLVLFSLHCCSLGYLGFMESGSPNKFGKGVHVNSVKQQKMQK